MGQRNRESQPAGSEVQQMKRNRGERKQGAPVTGEEHIKMLIQEQQSQHQEQKQAPHRRPRKIDPDHSEDQKTIAADHQPGPPSPNATGASIPMAGKDRKSTRLNSSHL